MRKSVNINNNWKFKKKHGSVLSELPKDWESVNLPHTWNGDDGQDGGNDYFRGKCCYVRELDASEFSADAKVFIEFCAVNSSAEVYVNGKKAGSHDGGYSLWRADITPYLTDKNIICVIADNSSNDRVYPQVADFTFYGGIYRDVNIISVPASHFCLDYYGGNGLKITPEVNMNKALVEAEVFLTDAAPSQTLVFTIKDGETVIETRTVSAEETKQSFEIDNVRLWNGIKDPHLYSMEVSLKDGDNALDTVSSDFGCRSFKIDPQKGFILNGNPYPLRGVSRHQDRPHIGNALLPEHHSEDIDLICELGATTVRLAHYQHNQYFYDLCDKKGLVVWAEIPYISNHMKQGRENTVSQMKELITQNYNHPSIVVWGLSNEITMGGIDSDITENHKILNDLAHSMDKTRLTTVAAISTCPPSAEYLAIPDVLSYNHYFGWYGGSTEMNGPWLDKFHKKYPNRAIGLSEYGCEALNWHTSDPVQGDYTEEYQAYYHEALIKQIIDRPYLWATHVWNMFDFAADLRAEGGENGMNHKGLVTFDRKYKKDSFYAYKAWLSDEPFVHICGKRYVNRAEDTTKVTVYTNQPQVELFSNGESLGVQKRGKYPFYYYNVKLNGETKLTAKAGDCTDESVIVKVDKPDESYIMKDANEVINWFEIETPEGRFSVNDKIGDIVKTPSGLLACLKILKVLKSSLKKSDKKDGADEEKGKSLLDGLNINSGIIKMAMGFTVKRALSMANGMFSKEQILEINRILNKAKKRK